jgi:hypothetical protein
LLGITTARPAFDALTISTLSTKVTEETQRPRTPLPPTRLATPAASGSGAGALASDSALRLASIAIERGRALREAGDLAGAMKVFRSVLEIAPGNSEALHELEEMERAVSKLTQSGRAAAVAASSPTVVMPASSASSANTVARPGTSAPIAPLPDTVAPPTLMTPVAIPPKTAAPSRKPSTAVSAAIAIVGAFVLIMAVLAGTGYYIWTSRIRPGLVQTVAQQTGAAVSSSSAPLTTSSVAPPPAAVESPATSSVPTVTVSAPEPPKETTIVIPPPTSSVAPPAANAKKAPPAQPPADRSSRDTTTSARAASPPETPPSTPEPPPAAAAPTSSVAPEPAPPPKNAPIATVMVRHNHARSLFKGGGYCEGPLQLLADGVYFKTSGSSDGRNDEKMIPFKSIEGFELDGDKIHIETDDKNWDFVAPKNVLQQVEAFLKAHVKQ